MESRHRKKRLNLRRIRHYIIELIEVAGLLTILALTVIYGVMKVIHAF